MTKKRVLGTLASAALMLVAEQALSVGYMSCGVHKFSGGGRHGPGMYEVLKKCGEPTFRRGNTWVYDQGGGRRKVLFFDDAGYLLRIGDGGR